MGTRTTVICRLLEAEGIPADPGYPPMYRYDLFQPQLSRLPVPSAFPERFDFSQMHLPAVERAGESEAVWLEECVFRAGHQGVDDVVAALLKLQAHAAEIANIQLPRE